MKARDLKEMTREELTSREQELGREVFNLRFQKGLGQLGNTAMLQKTRKDLARVKTMLRQKELGG